MFSFCLLVFTLSAFSSNKKKEQIAEVRKQQQKQLKIEKDKERGSVENIARTNRQERYSVRRRKHEKNKEERNVEKRREEKTAKHNKNL